MLSTLRLDEISGTRRRYPASAPLKKKTPTPKESAQTNVTPDSPRGQLSTLHFLVLALHDCQIKDQQGESTNT